MGDSYGQELACLIIRVEKNYSFLETQTPKATKNPSLLHRNGGKERNFKSNLQSGRYYGKRTIVSTKPKKRAKHKIPKFHNILMANNMQKSISPIFTSVTFSIITLLTKVTKNSFFFHFVQNFLSFEMSTNT